MLNIRMEYKKWDTLEHNGVYFPESYKILPKSIKLKYDGKPIELLSDAEEAAYFYASILNTDYAKNKIFNKNFFNDFKTILKENKENKENNIIKDLKLCDFSKIAEYIKKQKIKNKSLSKEDKNSLKLKREKVVKKFMYAKVNGKEEKVGNFRIEPPGLFRGRGEHPLTGRIKRRIQPEDIIINIGETATIPQAPEGHQWKSIIHDHTATWLASWKENINDSIKYVFLAAGSTWKNSSDSNKFDKARELSHIIKDIRKNYIEDLKDSKLLIRQRATALYFIDKFALRAGNEKGSDKADTVGCCTLKVKHINLENPLVVIFDFLGKDSIRYFNKVKVSKDVFNNLIDFQKNKSKNDLLFDKLNTILLNKYLNSLMDNLTAKVFRTYNASYTFENELKETKKNDTIKEKLIFYNYANKQVAILCNHQKAVSSSHEIQIKKIKDKILELKLQLKEATNSNKSSKIKSKINDLKEKINQKEENKCVSLGTSKTNYLDPRISIAWCKKYDVPINKVFTKTLEDKFQWAMDVNEDWKFTGKIILNNNIHNYKSTKSTKNSVKRSAKSSTKKSSKRNVKSSTKKSAKRSTKSIVKRSVKSSTKKSAKSSTKKSAKRSAKKTKRSAKRNAKKTKSSTKRSTKRNTKKSVKKSIKRSTKSRSTKSRTTKSRTTKSRSTKSRSTKKITKRSTKRSAKSSNKRSAKRSAKRSTKRSTKRSVKSSIKKESIYDRISKIMNKKR